MKAERNSYLNRWIQPDTIVPQPGDPQSLNRYSYVSNNPVRYTDPTGHRVCDEDTGDCSTDRWNPFGASADLTAGQLRAIYGIQLTADAGQSWSAADIRNISEAVQQAAAALDYSTWKDGHPTVSNIAQFFKQIFGALGFNRSSDAGLRGAYASTSQVNGNEVVEVYSNAPAGHFSAYNAEHEMGHAFAQRLGGQPYNDLNASVITDNQGNVIAGGGGPGSYVRSDDGYATAGFPWQQHRQVMGDLNDPPTANEDFADMFLGWGYGNFASNGAGAARDTWMSANMPRWIPLAVNGN